MTYDLRRLRRRGLIARLAGSHRYVVTALGLRVAYLYTRLYSRLLKPAWRALLPAPLAPPRLQRALRTLDRHLSQLLEEEPLPKAA